MNQRFSHLPIPFVTKILCMIDNCLNIIYNRVHGTNSKCMNHKIREFFQVKFKSPNVTNT